jgi:hypothetical protein
MRRKKDVIGFLLILGVALLIVSGLVSAQVEHRNNTIVKLLTSAADGEAGDYFGRAVAIDGNYAVVGAHYADSDSGAVYVFERDMAFWSGPIRLTAYDGDTPDRFGTSVAISGNLIAVGAPGDSVLASIEGSVYIFERTGGTWVEEIPKLHAGAANDDEFGKSVALSGNYLIVGAPGTDIVGNRDGCAYVFERISGNWVFQAQITASDGASGHQFGRAVSIDGECAVVGAHWADGGADSTGAVYVFEKDMGVWGPTETAKLTASDGDVWDLFGASVSIDGDRIVVGALQGAYPEGFPGNGAAYVFDKPGSNWVSTTETTKLTPYGGEMNDRFGYSVDVDADTIIVGAPMDDDLMGHTAGCVYIYKLDGAVWEEHKIRAADADTSDYFGRSVAITGGCAIVGADGDDEYGSSSGCAYVIEAPYEDDRYFVHMADLHVRHKDNVWWPSKPSKTWEKELKQVLDLRPPPEFVTAAGDLVHWGETSKGRKNYDALVGSPYLNVDDAFCESYLFDAYHEIPIFFSPGNHDYREKKLWPSRTYLTNYYDKICFDRYFHAMVGPYAIFSLDTRYDYFYEGIFLPEGRGITDTDLIAFTDDLDDLDEIDDEQDNSPYTKIAFMHHPHDSRTINPLSVNGEFIGNNPEYVGFLGQYGVDFAVYGHLHKKKEWTEGNTQCYIAGAAKHGAHVEVSLHGGAPLSWWRLLWALFRSTFWGDVNTFALDQDGNRTGLYPPDTSYVQIDIPNSDYYWYSYMDSSTMNIEIMSEITVVQADTMDYTFIAEALSADTLTVNFEVIRLDGSISDLWYEGIPLLYEGGVGSVCTLSAPASVGGYELVVEDPDGTTRKYTPIITLVEDEGPVPAALKLFQNYPNPFNPTTTIRYELPKGCHVRLEIYNVRGQRVITLIDELQSAGSKTVRWSGVNRRGAEVASGVYFYRLKAGSTTDTKKMVLIR